MAAARLPAMLAVTAPAPGLVFVLLVPIVGTLCCIAIGSLVFGSWIRFRRR
jgi:hypothetical protein